MTKGILGKKLGMTQVFTPEGLVVPVTVIQAGPCVVLQKKDVENDGYEAIQIGFDDKKEKRAIKPELGHAKKAGAAPKRYIKEVRGVALADYEVGQELKADLFTEGEFVDVTGTSKGKGFSGTIKRWNQSRGPMAHGVPKGKHLPGHMGGETVTLQNLQVVKVDAERNVLLVKGSIPGPNNSYVSVKLTVKK
jgi:large subunit ribosomal protein L3